MPPTCVRTLRGTCAAADASWPRRVTAGLAFLAIAWLGLAGPSPAVAAGAARAARFQVEALGQTALLSGSSSLAEEHDIRDVHSDGFGFLLGASLGLTANIQIGLRTGLFREEKDLAPSLALTRWQSLPGYNPFRAPFATSIHRKLTVVPTHAVLQYRNRFAGPVGFYDEIGVGVARFTEKVNYFHSGTTMMRLAGYQTNLSLLFGGGLSWDYKTVATVVAGVDVEMIPSRDGEVWGGGDNPQYIAIQLGIRYPRR